MQHLNLSYYGCFASCYLTTFHGSNNLAMVEISGDLECFHSCLLKIIFNWHFLSTLPLRFSHLFPFSPPPLQIPCLSITHIPEIIVSHFLFTEHTRRRLQKHGPDSVVLLLRYISLLDMLLSVLLFKYPVIALCSN